MAIVDDDLVLLITSIDAAPNAFYKEPPLLGQVEDVANGIVVWGDGRRSDYGGSIATNDSFQIVAAPVAAATTALINSVLRALGENFGQLAQGPAVRVYSLDLPSASAPFDFVTIKTPLGFFSATPAAFEVVPGA